MSTLDEQISYAQQLVNDGLYPEYTTGILASLRELKAIKEALPEPVKWWRWEGSAVDPFEKGWFQSDKPERNGVALYPESALMAERAKRVEAESRLARLEAVCQYYADAYQVADEAGELQHWPADEVERCRAIAVALKGE